MAALFQGFSQDDFCIGICFFFHFFRIQKNMNLYVIEGPCPCKFEVGIGGKINGEAEKIIVDEKHRKSRSLDPTRITVKY